MLGGWGALGRRVGAQPAAHGGAKDRVKDVKEEPAAPSPGEEQRVD